MSVNGKRVRKPEPYTCGKDCPVQPGDEAVGGWSREKLIRMDADFVAQVERAFENGSEPPSISRDEWLLGCMLAPR